MRTVVAPACRMGPFRWGPNRAIVPRMSDLLSTFKLQPKHQGAATGQWLPATGPVITSIDPATGAAAGSVTSVLPQEYAQVVKAAQHAFADWRTRPAPLRGQLVETLGALLLEHKDALAQLITLEVGKITSEAAGEVQEMIDICTFAVGLSRQLHGLLIASERPQHRMMEQWHPLGPVGVVTAFNFPMAVWAWNAALAAVCGDTVVWKPSPTAPLCAAAVQQLCHQAMARHDAQGVFCLVQGGAELGTQMAQDARLPLLSFTGSVESGRQVAQQVAARLGRSLLELGGNNAVTVLDDADLDLAVRAIVFGAVGTAGQRCTSTRRVFVQRGVAAQLKQRLTAAYASVTLGHPGEPGTLLGPLISPTSVERYLAALDKARAQGGLVLHGAARVDRPGFYVLPTLVAAPAPQDFPVAFEETFAPILYVFEVDGLEQAIAANNAVSQGLSSALFTDSLRRAELFLSAQGSDCGIANVNLGTSGAEIGGAFGGEKDTGGGRESGSDAWKAYMRRQTCTVNWGTQLPLAQGVSFL